jgi:hypothetical protein
MPAGRPPGDGQTFTQVCHFIKTDGVSDAEAALLAGQDAAWLQGWVEAHPSARRDLEAVRAEFHRQRLELIRTCLKKDDVEWRAQVYLRENTPAAPKREPAANDDSETRGLPAGARHNWEHNFIITPDHLRELQRHRQQALAKLNPQPEAAQP